MKYKTDTQTAFYLVWKILERHRARSVLRRVNAAASAAGVRVYLNCGTLLGFVRERKILDWDDDIDLLLIKSDKTNYFISEIFKQGLNILDHRDPEWKDMLKVYDDSFAEVKWKSYEYTWPFVDVFIFEIKSGALICDCPFNRWSFQSDLVSPGRQETFEGSLCWIPEQPLAILDHYYRDWRTKEVSSSWSHRREEAVLNVVERPIATDVTGRRLTAKNTTASLSIVIPTHNSASTIDATIESVVGQSCRDWELIVVDDASEDDTQVIIRRRLDDQRIRLIVGTRPRVGVSLARNRGARQARSNWLLFLDSDDLIAPEFVQTMLLATRTDPAPDFVYCCGARLAPDGRIGEPEIPPSAELFGDLACRNPLFTHSCIVRRGIFEILGGFDADLESCEDWDLWQRIARCGFRTVRVDACLSLYRMGATSLSRNAPILLGCAQTVIRRGHGRDPRIRNPLPRLANGLPAVQAPAALANIVLWCAALTIGSDADPQLLLNRAEILPLTTLNADQSAAMIRFGVPQGACLLQSEWPMLRQTFGARIRAALELFEKRCDLGGLADQIADLLYRDRIGAPDR